MRGSHRSTVTVASSTVAMAKWCPHYFPSMACAVCGDMAPVKVESERLCALHSQMKVAREPGATATVLDEAEFADQSKRADRLQLRAVRELDDDLTKFDDMIRRKRAEKRAQAAAQAARAPDSSPPAALARVGADTPQSRPRSTQPQRRSSPDAALGAGMGSGAAGSARSALAPPTRTSPAAESPPAPAAGRAPPASTSRSARESDPALPAGPVGVLARALMHDDAAARLGIEVSGAVAVAGRINAALESSVGGDAQVPCSLRNRGTVLSRPHTRSPPPPRPTRGD